MMQLIDLTGHAMLRYWTRPVVDKYVGINENEFASKRRKGIDDYLIQKDYFKNKKDNQEFKRF